jgi:hypothetical protein
MHSTAPHGHVCSHRQLQPRRLHAMSLRRNHTQPRYDSKSASISYLWKCARQFQSPTQAQWRSRIDNDSQHTLNPFRPKQENTYQYSGSPAVDQSCADHPDMVLSRALQRSTQNCPGGSKCNRPHTSDLVTDPTSNETSDESSKIVHGYL